MTPLVEATGHRHGLARPPVFVPVGAADVPGVHHASVAHELDPNRSAGGGVARTAEAAAEAAVAETLERQSAATAAVPARAAASVPTDQRVGLSDWSLHSTEQRASAGYPFAAHQADDERLTEVFDLCDNTAWWVPSALVTLRPTAGGLATSSGLAAGRSVVVALLRATQELVERDAYVVTWLHQLGGREVPAPDLRAEVAPLGGTVRAFDLTQDFSPHRVAAVTGTAPLAGAPRHSLGLACRATWAAAVEKAYLEMLQGVVFVGHHLGSHPELQGLPAEAVTDFDRHAIYYSANPDRWADVPLHRGATPATAASGDAGADPPDRPGNGAALAAAQLRELVTALSQAGARLFYRELTTVDTNQVGLRVVRVLSPDLALLHPDHRWPFLGGRTADAGWRYGDATERATGPFPSPYPHALG